MTAEPRWLRVVAWSTTAVIVAGVGTMVLRGRSLDVLYARWLLHNVPTGLVAVWLGTMVLRRRPGHGSGLLLLALGVASAFHVGTVALADARLVAAGAPERGSEFLPFAPADLPLSASLPVWLSSWLWLLAAVPAITLLLLVFPTGAPPGPRWRWVVPVALVGTAGMALAYAIEVWPRSTVVIEMRGQVGAHRGAVVVATAAGLLVVVAAVASLVSLGVRWRGAGPDERRQIRPTVITGAGLIVVFVATFPWQWLWIPAGMVALWALLVAYAIGVGRYRLHDLDVVVNRAVVGAVLAAGATGLYFGIVVAAGAVAGRGRDSTLVPLVAAAAVAVAFEPARRRTRSMVDRLLYGRDGDAAQVLSGLADRLRTSTSAGHVLDEVATLLVRSTGAAAAEIESGAVVAESGAHRGGEALLEVPVRHEGELLGRIRLWGRARTDLVPDAERLVRDVAGTLGVVLRNVALTAELEAQVDELRISRRRLVQAQDEARRALERDIHDGAQSRLVALRIHVGVAAALVDAGDVDRLGALLAELGTEVDESIRVLRSLGHGLHPPVLEGAGIAAALRSEARALTLPVVVEAEGVGRYPPEVEAAVYFSCLEALQNAAKHGGARSVTVVLVDDGRGPAFAVVDDGQGFDPAAAPPGAGLTNMRDRVGSLGGELVVDAAPGRGTTVRGTVPSRALAPGQPGVVGSAPVSAR